MLYEKENKDECSLDPKYNNATSNNRLFFKQTCERGFDRLA